MFWVLDRQIYTEDDDSVYGVVCGGDDPTWEISSCSVCGRFHFGKQINNQTIELFGTTFLDFIWLDDPSLIISASLKNLLINSDLKGFTFRNVDIQAWNSWIINSSGGVGHEIKKIPPKLFQLVITGRGGSLFPQNKMQIKASCNICGITSFKPLENGILVDENQWDKSDIFLWTSFLGLHLLIKSL